MSGEKKFNKDAIMESLERKAYSERFKLDIKNIRREHGIPQNGFKNIDYGEWAEDYNYLFLEFRRDIDNILIKHGLPLGAGFPLEVYTLTNKFSLLSKNPPNFYSCDLDQTWSPGISSPIEEKWRKSGEKFVRVYIGENVSLRMVQNYIEQHWSIIQNTFFKNSESKKLIRRSSNFERDKLIGYYYQKSRSELGLIKGKYKDMKVADILMDKHGIKITPEHVRKIAQRMKKLRDT